MCGLSPTTLLDLRKYDIVVWIEVNIRSWHDLLSAAVQRWFCHGSSKGGTKESEKTKAGVNRKHWIKWLHVLQVPTTGRATYYVSYKRESFIQTKLPKYSLAKVSFSRNLGFFSANNYNSLTVAVFQWNESDESFHNCFHLGFSKLFNRMQSHKEKKTIELNWINFINQPLRPQAAWTSPSIQPFPIYKLLDSSFSHTYGSCTAEGAGPSVSSMSEAIYIHTPAFISWLVPQGQHVLIRHFSASSHNSS